MVDMNRYKRAMGPTSRQPWPQSTESSQSLRLGFDKDLIIEAMDEYADLYEEYGQLR